MNQNGRAAFFFYSRQFQTFYKLVSSSLTHVSIFKFVKIKREIFSFFFFAVKDVAALHTIHRKKKLERYVVETWSGDQQSRLG